MFLDLLFLLPLLPCHCENQKEHYRGITGTGNPGIFQCHLVEWFVSSLAEWSYIRSAVPYLNRKTINQPAQPQQHNDFLPSEDDQWWFSTDFKSPQIVKSSVFLKRDGTVVSRTLELVLCGLVASPCMGFLQLFPSIINFSEQGVGIRILCLLLFSSIPSASHSSREFGGSISWKPPKSWRKSKLMQLFPSSISGWWGRGSSLPAFKCEMWHTPVAFCFLVYSFCSRAAKPLSPHWVYFSLILCHASLICLITSFIFYFVLVRHYLQWHTSWLFCRKKVGGWIQSFASVLRYSLRLCAFINIY